MFIVTVFTDSLIYSVKLATDITLHYITLPNVLAAWFLTYQVPICIQCTRW